MLTTELDLENFPRYILGPDKPFLKHSQMNHRYVQNKKIILDQILTASCDIFSDSLKIQGMLSEINLSLSKMVVHLVVNIPPAQHQSHHPPAGTFLHASGLYTYFYESNTQCTMKIFPQ
jgi:hypothetical protein